MTHAKQMRLIQKHTNDAALVIQTLFRCPTTVVSMHPPVSEIPELRNQHQTI